MNRGLRAARRSRRHLPTGPASPAREQAPLQAVASMRKRRMAGSEWTTCAGLRRSQMQPARLSARRKQRSASRNGMGPPSDKIRPPSKAAPTFLRRTAGRSKGRRLSSVMAGVAYLLLGEEDASTTNSCPMATAYATSATLNSDPMRIIRVSPLCDLREDHLDGGRCSETDWRGNPLISLRCGRSTRRA